jgi:hypothetical protein
MRNAAGYGWHCRNPCGFLQVLSITAEFAGKMACSNPGTCHLEVFCMPMTALETYRLVIDLVQQGQTHQARELAVTIPIDYLRGHALLLVNYSRRL